MIACAIPGPPRGVLGGGHSAARPALDGRVRGLAAFVAPDRVVQDVRLDVEPFGCRRRGLRKPRRLTRPRYPRASHPAPPFTRRAEVTRDAGSDLLDVVLSGVQSCCRHAKKCHGPPTLRTAVRDRWPAR